MIDWNDILKSHIPGFPKTNIVNPDRTEEISRIVKRGFESISDPNERLTMIELHLTSIQNKLGLLVDKYDFKRNLKVKADFEVIKEAIDKLIDR